MRAIGVALTMLAVVVAAAPAAAKGPPPLSAETTADVASTHGSGNLGRWAVDGVGLPAFDYRIDHLTDPRGQLTELKGRTRTQHQIGNDHVKGMAFNDGTTQLWSQARLAQWANWYDPAVRQYAGGYGYLNVDGQIVSTLWDDRPAAGEFDRRFGVGYLGKRVRAQGVEVREHTYSPFGDDPLLLHDVTIENTSGSAKTVSWFEYWGVNPRVQPNFNLRNNRGTDAPVWNGDARSVTVAQHPYDGDTRPLTIFAAQLAGPLDGFETNVDAFFGAGSRGAPAAVAADRLDGGIAPPSPAGQHTNKAMVAFRAPVTLTPGESVTLRYAYGMAHAEQVGGLVDKYRAAGDPLRTSQAAWARWVPKSDFGDGNEWVARELAWDAYLLRSASHYEEECGAHMITQGGGYQYSAGLNMGFRSWLHYVPSIMYGEPELAREILRYAIKLQPEATNEFPYGTQALCKRLDLGTSSDLDIVLLHAAAEYGLALRDPDFFDEPLPFYDTKGEISAWEHLKLAYRHNESRRGPHGGYLVGATGDWSDFLAELGPMTESTLVAAQAAYTYPKLAELAELRGDEEFARELRATTEGLREFLEGEWTGRGWFSRGYFGDKQIGKGLPYGEPQGWAVVAGIPSAGQSATLVANHRRFLRGEGAPGGPSLIGSAQAPARDDPDITERGPAIDPTEAALPDLLGPALATAPALGGAAAWPGGVWYEVNSWWTWALAELDGVVPNARELAWDEYTRNTLARHATVYPDHWNGTISVEDVCNAWYSTDPSFCGISVEYAGQNSEQPSAMVGGALRLAGLEPTRDGLVVDPHLPMETFSLRMPRVGLAARPGQRRGYLAPERSGEVELRVAVPAAARGIRAYVDGAAVSSRVEDGFAIFTAVMPADEATDWSVTWR